MDTDRLGRSPETAATRSATGDAPVDRDPREAARRRLILALDVADLGSARTLVQQTRKFVGALKIGKELFTSCGPEAIHGVADSGLPIFLDLKFHDIPNTVAAAVRAAGEHGVRWISLHTSGGAAMLEAAARARDELAAERRPRLLGVTVLTSLDVADPEEIVDRALLARRCGLDGAIASPREVARLRAACGGDFLLVTPGVRPTGAAAGDQARVATPAAAIRDGADMLVVGRPIRAAADPASAASALLDEVAAALRRTPSRKETRPAPESEPSARTKSPPSPALPGSIDGRLLGMLRDSGAFLEGHFVLTSGLHSDRYVQCARLLQHPRHARRAGLWLAERLRSYDPQVVIGVALGGLVIGQEVAAALGVRAIFAERDASGTLRLRRGFALEPGERVAIVDDVCTRGGSIAACDALVRQEGAAGVVAGAIIDRSGGERCFGLPFEALKKIEADAVRPEDCDACAAGIPAVKPGSRHTAG